MLKVFILVNHCLGQLGNIERKRGGGGGRGRIFLKSIRKLGSVPDVLSRIVVSVTKLLGIKPKLQSHKLLVWEAKTRTYLHFSANIYENASIF